MQFLKSLENWNLLKVVFDRISEMTGFVSPPYYAQIENRTNSYAYLQGVYTQVSLFGAGIFDKFTTMDRMFYRGMTSIISDNPIESRAILSRGEGRFDVTRETVFALVYLNLEDYEQRMRWLMIFEAILILMRPFFHNGYPQMNELRPLYALNLAMFMEIGMCVGWSIQRCSNFFTSAMSNEQLRYNVTVAMNREQAEYEEKMNKLQNMLDGLEMREEPTLNEDMRALIQQNEMQLLDDDDIEMSSSDDSDMEVT